MLQLIFPIYTVNKHVFLRTPLMIVRYTP
jgi:hypothetical protein